MKRTAEAGSPLRRATAAGTAAPLDMYYELMYQLIIHLIDYPPERRLSVDGAGPWLYAIR